MYTFDCPVKFSFSFCVAFCNDEFPVGRLNSLSGVEVSLV